MTLESFKSYLDKSLKENTEMIRESLLIEIKDNILRDVIKSILENDWQLKHIAEQSYRHNNGFEKILLVDNRPDYAIRLHLWDGNFIEDSNIHNHEWDLNGIVLYGNYRWQLFDKETESLKKPYFNYKCIYNNNYKSHTLIPEANVNMLKYFDCTMNEGSYYSINGTKYHRILHTHGVNAATLILHSNTFYKDIEVYSKNELNSLEMVESKCYSENELKLLLEKFITNLGEEHGHSKLI